MPKAARIPIKAMCHVTGGAGPTIFGNSGPFGDPVRTGAGLYTLSLDQEFPVFDTDVVHAQVEGATPLAVSVVRTSATAIGINFLNAAAAAADPTNFAVWIEGPRIG